MYSRTYHTFALSDRFVPPDLAVAFNSGSSEEDVASWRQTMKVLIQRKIPSVFTVFQYDTPHYDIELTSFSGL